MNVCGVVAVSIFFIIIKNMSEFDKRQKGFEKKHVMDEEKKFKIESRRNKYIGEWVSDILNYNEDQKKIIFKK